MNSMAKQSLRKRRLEEKLGLDQPETIKSGFDKETMTIVWDIIHKKYDGLRDHPLIKQDEASCLRYPRGDLGCRREAYAKR